MPSATPEVITRRTFLAWGSGLLAYRPRRRARYQDRYFDAYRRYGR